MKLVIDLDGTICNLRKEGQDYSEVVPNFKAIKKLKILKEKGHYIIIQTARHMETCNSNLGKVNARIGKKTLDWLERNEVPYDEIFFGKPNGAIYLDDNAKNFTGWEDISDIENYSDDKVNVVIPMAGAGSRFVKAGYKLPKPLIDVKGKTMVEWAVSSLDFLKKNYNLNYIFVVLNQHIIEYNIDSFLKEKYPGCKVVGLDKITRGQAETVYKAKEYINDFNKLIIYNSDTYSNYSLEAFPIHKSNIDGIIPCFESSEDKFSYAKLDEYSYVAEVAEKKAISSHATNGLYYFRRGNEFITFVEKMILNNDLSGGEFYVGPLYNSLINIGKRIVISPIKENWVLGTPDELQYFLNNYK